MDNQVLFRDRAAAGRLLAHHLDRFRGPDTVVLGIPRGGVLVAAEVARSLGAWLDLAIAHKLPAPGHPEVAIGAVTAAGGLYLDTATIRWLGVPAAYLREAIEHERAESMRRERAFRGGQPALPLDGRLVIVVDDGLATGATMRVALRAVRRSMPRRLIAAAPVGSPDGCAVAREEADEVVCPFAPPELGAVSVYYEDFHQVTDSEVRHALRQESNSTLDPAHTGEGL
jgi:predicted phosphoribosyltransferase